ncbi:MAG: HAD-IA family hydrolase [Planctomycetota bacterium]
MNWSDEWSVQVRSLSFDCYGTLIDWITGIGGIFRILAGSGGSLPLDERAFFDTYLQAEAQAEAGPYMPYREVLCTVQRALARRFGLQLRPEQANLLAESLPNWRPFPEVNSALARLKTRYRLGILSNIDRDLFAATAEHFDVSFDFVITAEDVHSYKPGKQHFLRLLDTVVHEPQCHLHVAQSLFHDGVPAAELSIPFVWINRRSEVNDTTAKPLAVLANLAELAQAMGV